MSQLHVVPSWRRMYLRGKCGGDASAFAVKVHVPSDTDHCV